MHTSLDAKLGDSLSWNGVADLATVIFLVTSFVLLSGRLLALTMDEGDGETRTPISIRRMVSVAAEQARRHWRLLWLDPPPAPAIARLGAALCVTPLAIRGGAGLTRGCLWKSLNLTEDHLLRANFWVTPRYALEWVYFQERGIQKAVAILAIPVALFAAWAFLRKPLRRSHPAGLREPRALAGLNPLLARRDIRSHQSGCFAFLGDLVRRLLEDLAE